MFVASVPSSNQNLYLVCSYRLSTLWHSKVNEIWMWNYFLHLFFTVWWHFLSSLLEFNVLKEFTQWKNTHAKFLSIRTKTWIKSKLNIWYDTYDTDATCLAKTSRYGAEPLDPECRRSGERKLIHEWMFLLKIWSKCCFNLYTWMTQAVLTVMWTK